MGDFLLRPSARLALFALLVVAFARFVMVYAQSHRGDEWRCRTLPTPAYAFDPADDRELVEHATDVFVGQVIDQIPGPEPATPVPGWMPGLPVSHYAVEVVRPIKGTAVGTIVVVHFAAMTEHGCLNGVAGDSPLRPRQTAIFAAVADSATGVYSLFPGSFSHIRIRSPQEQATQEVRFLTLVGTPPPFGQTGTPRLQLSTPPS